MIEAKVIADSKNEFGNRITTMVVTFPRFILAELNTHRMFSRNSASSRAIPFKKMLKSVQENPFIPIAWQKEHKGMQGVEYITDSDIIQQCEWDWLQARDFAVQQAESLNRSLGVTKQLCNRLLEPFMWHTVIISATEFSNFFELRCPRYETKFGNFFSKKDARNAEIDITGRNPNIGELELPSLDDTLGWLELNKGQAEIHMMALAEAMWDAISSSTPKLLKSGEYHIPMIEIEED
jgi:hypothetical protein